MKKRYVFTGFLIIVVAAFCFFSCSKKNNPDPVTLTGKWNITADTSRTVGYSPYVIVGINSPYMQFNADGSGVQKFNIAMPDNVVNFTYTVHKDTLAFNYQHPYVSTPKAVIKKLTSKNLVLEYTINTPPLIDTERVYMSR